jgi:hypothetical protein
LVISLAPSGLPIAYLYPPPSARSLLTQMMPYTRYLLSLLTLTTLSLASCSTPLAQTAPVPSPEPIAVKSPASPRPPSAKPRAKPAKTVTVNAYKLDGRCTQQIAEPVTVSAQQPIQGAIAKAIELGSNSDFSLSGFRVNVKSGLATVDLRVAPNSKRRLQSLSVCERMALLGSVRRTLMGNAQWKIKTVKFTDRGKALVL